MKYQLRVQNVALLQLRNLQLQAHQLLDHQDQALVVDHQVTGKSTIDVGQKATVALPVFVLRLTHKTIVSVLFMIRKRSVRVSVRKNTGDVLVLSVKKNV
jgi:hypothetical protein